MIKQIRSKLVKGKGVEVIAEALEESVEFVQKVVDIIKENIAVTDVEVVDRII